MYNVLVVDDNIENIDVLRAILKDEFNVKAATNGAAALKVAEKTAPDIILLDIIMPEMDGYAVCKKLKENPLTGNIPVIFVTAKNQEIDEVKGYEAGAVDYLNKPVSPAIAKARIKIQLALSDQKKALEMQVKDKTREINETRLEIIRKLGHAAEYRDNDTGMHVERMSRYCYHIALAYGLSRSQAELILNASPMHDVGKIGIPDLVLRKPGKLEADEWELMIKHTEIGGNIIGSTHNELLNTAKIVAEQHHEKWNGKGYPKGLKADEINIFARITSVADVFDALTSERPYKKGWAVEAAVQEIKQQSGQQFDPEVVEAFFKTLPKIIEIKEEFAEKGEVSS